MALLHTRCHNGTPKDGGIYRGAVFSMEGFKTRLIMSFLVAVSLFQVTMQEGELVITLDSFENSDNKDYNGVVCDKGHWGSLKYCDPYFIICVTDFRNTTSAANCPLMKMQTESWTNTGNVDFKSKKLIVNFKIWKGYAGLYIVAMDEDPVGNPDDLIDKLSATIFAAAPANGTFSLETPMILQGKHTSFKLSTKVRCLAYFFGSDCGTHCQARDTDLEGHYSCNISGGKVCHSNWYGPNCTTYCIPKHDNHGHYRCDSSNGTKICIEGWYSVNCTVYCRERDDGFGHYKCDPSTGRKICNLGWYGLNCTLKRSITASLPHFSSKSSHSLLTGIQLSVKSSVSWSFGVIKSESSLRSTPSLETAIQSPLSTKMSDSPTTSHVSDLSIQPITSSVPIPSELSSILLGETATSFSINSISSKPASSKIWLLRSESTPPSLSDTAIPRTLTPHKSLSLPPPSLAMNATLESSWNMFSTSFISSSWPEKSTSLATSITNSQPTSALIMPLDSSLEDISSSTRSITTMACSMSKVIVSHTLPASKAPMQESSSIMTSQRLPSTTAGTIGIKKAAAQDQATWLTETTAGKATLSVIVCSLIMAAAALVTAFCHFHRRKLKKQTNCMETKWESYVDNMGETGYENEVSKHIDAQDDHSFVRENPIYGFMNVADSTFDVWKCDDSLAFDCEENNGNGESTV